MSGTEVLHQDFGKHQTDFLTVPFVYQADRPRWNRKGLVCVWSINQKFVKHKVAPNEGSMRAYGLGIGGTICAWRGGQGWSLHSCPKKPGKSVGEKGWGIK